MKPLINSSNALLLKTTELFGGVSASDAEATVGHDGRTEPPESGARRGHAAAPEGGSAVRAGGPRVAI